MSSYQVSQFPLPSGRRALACITKSVGCGCNETIGSVDIASCLCTVSEAHSTRRKLILTTLALASLRGSSMLRRSWIAYTALPISAFSSVASADGIPQSQRYACAPSYSWTGWYAGLNAGGIWGGHDDTVSSVPTFNCNSATPSCHDSFPQPTSIAAANAASGMLSTNDDRFIGGGQMLQFAVRAAVGCGH
jgi:hypothetical protein